MITKSKHNSVKDIMLKNVLTVYPDQSIFHASVIMASKDVGALPVIREDNTLTGILTDRDIVIRCIAIGKDPKKTKVFECMTANPIRVVPSTSIADIMMLMGEYGISRLPVVERDKLIGLISISDIAKVSEGCPNMKLPDESCILIDIAKELGRSSHCKECCEI